MMSDQVSTEIDEPNRPLHGLKLLLVEDEALVAMELEDLIISLGGEVVGPFGRVNDALEALRRGAVDGAVLDVRLDGDTTFKIVDVLFQAANPVLFVTGAVDSIPEKYRHLPRLQKPFDYAQSERVANSIFRAK
jgi:DNA-binding LytR/AlgR family response regulator